MNMLGIGAIAGMRIDTNLVVGPLDP